MFFENNFCKQVLQSKVQLDLHMALMQHNNNYPLDKSMTILHFLYNLTLFIQKLNFFDKFYQKR